jgi:hypothetical protein
VAVTEEAWPTPQHPAREPLPRVDDLPIADQGYDQQSVKAAFDSFYRHAAQLDTALRTLEAVDSFHRQAAALRSDLRVLRTSGWTQQSWPTTPAYGYYGTRPAREGISPAVWRIAGEAAFIIAVAVVLGVAKLAWWVIVLVMAFAWLLVGLIEWAASRDFAVVRSEAAPIHPVVEAEAPAARTDEGESLGWAAFEEAQEPSDAMTMIGAPQVAEDGTGPAKPADEAAQAPALAEPASTPGPELVDGEPEAAEQPSRRWWHRGEAEDSEAPEPPRHVRVLPADAAPEAAAPIDPWERGFDEASLDSPELDSEPDEETGDHGHALAADVEPQEPRRFPRR